MEGIETAMHPSKYIQNLMYICIYKMNRPSKQTYLNEVKAYPKIYKNGLGGTVLQIFIQRNPYTSSEKNQKKVFFLS